MKSFEKRLQNRGYPTNVLEKHLSEVKFSDRKASLEQKNRVARRRINIALCNAISFGLAQLKDITKEEMATHTESTITKSYRASAYNAKENP